MQGGSEGASQFQHREASDVDHQRWAASESVPQRAKEDSPDRSKGERQEDGLGDRRHPGVEVLRDRRNTEDEDEEIEGVQRPAKQTGEEGVALTGGERAEVIEPGRFEDSHGMRRSISECHGLSAHPWFGAGLDQDFHSRMKSNIPDLDRCYSEFAGSPRMSSS